MLSRVAESLFWMGRYTERAELTARILDVHLQRVMEDPWLDESAACRALLTHLGMAAPTVELDSHRLMETLGYDRENRSSVAGALTAARENARGARDVISSEVWECLNATWLDLPKQREEAGAAGPHLFCRHVRQRTAMLTGLIDATVSRDDGRRFLELGWNLERAAMTTRLLSFCLGDPAVHSSWVALLRSCGAHEAFLKTYRHAADGPIVAEFLLLDRLFPRSVYSSLRAAERLLAELDTAGGPSRSGLDDPARRAIGRARTDLEFQRIEDIADGLPDLLARLQQTCSTVSGHIGGRYFTQPGPFTWAAGTSV
ncbi:alpha-E domain-containing protein [Pseudofrankia saprophytica]|uniref:alpha-E domain-containing protein n=1 Tax=Pseudofrankia saprophytica TaxID=298655 RepID=UPI0018E3A50A